MYYYLYGKLAHLQNDMAVIDCGGVGYLLSISGTTYDSIVKSDAYTPSGDLSDIKVKLYTHQAVREDSIELFGFFTLDECSLFKLLIGVSGIGPKAGLAILSALSPAGLVGAIAQGDARAIARAQGVGLKTAQKVIIELKDKVAKGFDLSGETTPVSDTNSYVPTSVSQEAIEALCVLGYTNTEAVKAVKNSSGSTVEDIIRNALLFLMK